MQILKWINSTYSRVQGTTLFSFLSHKCVTICFTVFLYICLHSPHFSLAFRSSSVANFSRRFLFHFSFILYPYVIMLFNMFALSISRQTGYCSTTFLKLLWKSIFFLRKSIFLNRLVRVLASTRMRIWKQQMFAVPVNGVWKRSAAVYR